METNTIVSGKKILFFAPAFFGYENKIYKALEKMGASVDFFDERSVSSSMEKALLKVNPRLFDSKTEQYYFDILEKVKSNAYDYIFFIKCDMPTEKVLLTYKETFQNAKMCLYMYDSIDNIPNVKKKFKYFDYVSTFDREDSIQEQIGFRPLFFCDEYRKELTNKEYEYDLCFIGTIHSDRYKILKEIKKQAEEAGLRVYLYPFLQSKFVYHLYKLTKAEFRDTNITDFRFDKISSEEIAKKVDASNMIIDIQHPKQTGLTMRTIEMIGMNKKIITTNQDIVNYNFYNDNNVQVVDRSSFKIDAEKIATDYVALDEEVYEYYSIYSWVECVLGERN